MRPDQARRPAWEVVLDDGNAVAQRGQEPLADHRPVVSLQLDADEVVRVTSGLRCLAHHITRNDPSDPSDLAALDQVERLLRRLAPVEDALLEQDRHPPRGPARVSEPERRSRRSGE